MQTVVKSIVGTLISQLGHQLEAIYLYGSLLEGYHHPAESDINLLLVLKDEHDIHECREVLRPIWQEHHSTLRHIPLIAPLSAFQRHLTLNPLLGYHLTQSGRCLYGKSDLMPPLPPANRQEMYARVLADLVRASGALAPQMLEPAEAAQRLKLLRRLGRRFLGQDVVAAETAVSIFGQLQTYLQQKMADLTRTSSWTKEIPPDTSFPGLQAIYREANEIVMVFAELTPEAVQATDWRELGAELKSDYAGLRVVTADQLRLMVEFNTPLDIKLMRYRHEWGLDPLADLDVAMWRILRTAARIPSYIRCVSFPHDYITAGDDQAGKVIHDFQNQMLNIRLEHELLCRLAQIERFEPPEPLPDPDTPSKPRITSLFQHFDWWAAYYTQAMQQVQGH